MCIKNVNANCLVCEEVKNIEGEYSISNVFDTAICKKNQEGKYVVEKLTIVIFLSAVGSDNDTPFGKRFDLRLTLVNRNTKRAKKLIDYKYEPNTSKIPANGLGQCKDYATLRLWVDVGSLILDEEELGDYVIKVWLKEEGDPDDWKEQTMQPVNFKMEDIVVE